MAKVVALIMAGGQGSRLYPADQGPEQAGRPDRRPVPADRHPDLATASTRATAASSS